jgi:hypothetical protein
MKMKAFKTVIAVIPMMMLACAYQHPVFQATGDHEEAHEIDCANGHGGYVLGWHRCHRPDPQGKSNADNGNYNCCADGYSCGEDDFVPSTDHVCRWRGMETDLPQ